MYLLGGTIMSFKDIHSEIKRISDILTKGERERERERERETDIFLLCPFVLAAKSERKLYKKKN